MIHSERDPTALISKVTYHRQEMLAHEMNRLHKHGDGQGSEEETDREPKAVPSWAVLWCMILNILRNKSHSHADQESAKEEVVNDPERRSKAGREQDRPLDHILVIMGENIVNHIELRSKGRCRQVRFGR